jgi:hypothetical protein
METIINVLLFILIIFFYFHIQNQLKRNEDLEISEMDYYDNESLQEICELKQPILFEYKPVNDEFFKLITLDILFSHRSQEIRVKDSSEYFDLDKTPDYILLPYQSANSLLISDAKHRYFSENNQEFIEETALKNIFEENNLYLKPAFNVNSKYDFFIGSANSVTPLRYHSHARQFLCVQSGKIHVKMTPWKSKKYLNTIKDFENYEFRSPLNPWAPQLEYADEMEKLRFLEFDVYAGYMLYIPPYWWYSIKFSDSKDNLITSFSYDNAISFITNIPNYSMYYLQQSNITKIITKRNDKENKKTIEQPNDDLTIHDEENSQSIEPEI